MVLLPGKCNKVTLCVLSKIHACQRLDLNVLYKHAIFMKAFVMLISKFHIRRFATYDSLHEIYTAKHRKGLVKNCKFMYFGLCPFSKYVVQRCRKII